MATGLFLQEELDKLRHDVLTMATKVEENLLKALSALKTGNLELVNEVRCSDAEVDAMQLKIEDDAAYIIATQHPVAGDLRELVEIFKITGNIERIGDYAKHLAKFAKIRAKTRTKNGESYFAVQENLERMAEIGGKMLRACINAFMAHDANMAREAAAMDGMIDEEHRILTEDILKLMKKNGNHIKSAVKLLNTSNQLERLGDHITNICEAIVFMIEGKHYELNS